MLLQIFSEGLLKHCDSETGKQYCISSMIMLLIFIPLPLLVSYFYLSLASSLISDILLLAPLVTTPL